MPEPVAVYQLPAPASGQISSNPAGMIRRSGRVQKQFLSGVPRSQNASRQERKRARCGFVRWAVPFTYGHLCQATEAGDKRVALECWWTILELQPTFAFRRRTLIRLARSLGGRGSATG